MRAITLALGLLIILLQATANSQISSASAESPRQSIASTFVSRQVEPLTQFRALHHLEATNTRFNKHGWMDVRTQLSPENHFSFAVLVSRGVATRSALTTPNYDFAAVEPAGSGVVRLTVRPLRHEMTLINGARFVTETGAGPG